DGNGRRTVKPWPLWPGLRIATLEPIMWRISKIRDYGTLVLTHMANSPERLCSASELARALGLKLPTVSKVLKLLGRHGLVRSVRGVQGGYALGRPASDISIAQVIDALEEQPFGLTECT